MQGQTMDREPGCVLSPVVKGVSMHLHFLKFNFKDEAADLLA